LFALARFFLARARFRFASSFSTPSVDVHGLKHGVLKEEAKAEAGSGKEERAKATSPPRLARSRNRPDERRSSHE